MKKLLSIGEAAKALGVTTTTMRNWDKNGMLHPDERTRGGDRRYSLDTLRNFDKDAAIHVDELKTIAYARVSSHDQKEDQVRQVAVLEAYCASKGYTYEVGRLVLTHKDRLLRFGAELVFAICEAKHVEVVIINKGDENIRFEEELAKDVLEIITVFSARLYGSRSNKNKKLLEDVQKAVENNVKK